MKNKVFCLILLASILATLLGMAIPSTTINATTTGGQQVWYISSSGTLIVNPGSSGSVKMTDGQQICSSETPTQEVTFAEGEWLGHMELSQPFTGSGILRIGGTEGSAGSSFTVNLTESMGFDFIVYATKFVISADQYLSLQFYSFTNDIYIQTGVHSFIYSSPGSQAYPDPTQTTTHGLTIGASAGGTTYPPPSATSYGFYDGAVAPIEARPDSGYYFTGWSESLTGDINPTTVTMDADKSVTANFAATLGTISGFVYQKDGETPLAGVSVNLLNATNLAAGILKSASTNSDGSYSLRGLEAGNYCVMAIADGYAQQLWQNALSTRIATVLAVNTTTSFSDVNFAMEAGGPITGTVTSKSTGQPIPNISVKISEADNTTNCQNVFTDSNGIYRFEAAYGNYIVCAPAGDMSGSSDENYTRQYYPGQSNAQEAGIITVDSTSGAGGIDFSLEPILYTLTLRRTGSGIVTPESGVHTYESGTTVSLTAAPSDDWSFSHWSGNPITEANAAENPLPITMYENKTITANFIAISAVDLVLTPSPSTVAIGQCFDVIIQAQSGSLDVAGIDAYLNFDPAKLAVLDMDNLTSGIQITNGVSLTSILQNSANNTSGHIDYSAGVLGGDSYPNGTFTVAIIRFEALAETSTDTAVTFSTQDTRPTLVTCKGANITGSLTGGTYTITGLNTSVEVKLQGSARPDSAWVVPLTVNFFTQDADVLNETPLYKFTLNTTRIDNITVQITCSDLLPGTYDISTVSPHTLVNVKKNVTINASTASLSLGTLLEGDVNNDERINILDFSLLSNAYRKTSSDADYDDMADFDGSGTINIADFSLLSGNYTLISPITVPW